VGRERIIAVGLLTRAHLDRIGADLTHVWPIDETPCFGDLLAAIDEADREQWRERDETPDLFARLQQEHNRC
jgi:hypothetical protein